MRWLRHRSGPFSALATLIPSGELSHATLAQRAPVIIADVRSEAWSIVIDTKLAYWLTLEVVLPRRLPAVSQRQQRDVHPDRGASCRGRDAHHAVA